MAADKAILLVVFAILLIAGIQMFDAGASAAADENLITNESWTSDPGTYVTLDRSNEGYAYNNSVVVRNATGATMTDGTDYDWNESDGTIKAIAGGDLDPAQSANITYSVEEQTEVQQGITAIIGGTLKVSHLMLVVLLVALMAAGLRTLGGV